MSLLSLSEVSFGYACGTLLFEGVTFSINPDDRVALVGPNGTGKSTLLRLIAGQLEPSRGEITRRRGLTVAIAGQDFAAPSGQKLFDFAFQFSPSLLLLRTHIRALEDHLSHAAIAGEYADLVNDYQEAGGYRAEAVVERTLGGLGFGAQDFDRDVRSLSGGERMRAQLAQSLSIAADLLILDEPTNHLDSAARAWLEDSLRNRVGACLIASHDRSLLEAFAERIIEVDRAQVRTFEGGYAEYRRSRALLHAQAWAAYEAFQRRKAVVALAARRRETLAGRVARTPDGLREGKDHYARKAAKVARTARILRQRVDDEHKVEKPWEEQPIDGLSFEQVPRSGDLVLVADHLTKAYCGRTLFRDLSFHLTRGGRLVIRGANGSGKTTLLRLIEGTIQPDDGSIRVGTNVAPAMVTQDIDSLDSQLSALQICGSDAAARTLFACLKLRPDCLNRPLTELSGGERTKATLARVLNSKANLLLLDEPTNHLEIEAQEALEQALASYPGAILVVSHDRFFIEALGPAVAFLDL
jgi:ATP-binding cassette subfamily F protein 3